ncbi:MAG: cysteine--tRNA ligase [Patescibacteria group bacterium]
MMAIKKISLHNTLTRQKDELVPVKPGEIGIYSCGPTVYWNQHIGHMYCYTQWDSLVRFLRYLGYKVNWVMNITDVGHLTSDGDIGDDKMEKGAKRENLSVWEIADKYIEQFMESLELLNIQKPDVFCRATEYVQEQIDLAKLIEKNGFAYQTGTGLVFDTSKFAQYPDFANLDLGQQEAGSRVDVDQDKKQPWDFLLWVNNQPNHIMQWDSPWGRGFPGWHLECTAMSVKHLGQRFDIHTGGREHIPVHHTNEIAQGYGAFGHQTANFWIHNEWLNLKGEKMSKSKGNFFTVADLKAKGFDPLAHRYLILSSHYRKGLDFSWQALKGAQRALERLQKAFSNWQGEPKESQETKQWQERFIEVLADDLNWPKAMAVVWEMVKSDLSDQEKKYLLLDWDQVLGFKIGQLPKTKKASKEIQELLDRRERLRKEKKYQEADKVREKIKKLGYDVVDA